MGFYDSEPLFSELEKKIIELSNEFSFINVETIGLSFLGRKIYGLSIGDNKNSVLYAGAFHAQEWLTATVLIKFLEEIAYNYKSDNTVYGINIRESLNKRGIVFVPMVNPDGVSVALEGAGSAGKHSSYIEKMMKLDNRSWQANARGVDLNHNFDAGFYELREIEKANSINEPCPRQYGGNNPHSEPETKAIVDFVEENAVDIVYAFHSQGEEIFYEYGNNTPKRSYIIANQLSSLSGYELISNDGLYSHGGFKDWFIEKQRKPGFTIEIGKGENPIPICDLDKIYKKIHRMLFFSIEL